MATYREIAYMVNDELKLFSNDASFTIEHIIFLAEKYRALLLERKYKDVRKGEIPHANYQTLCLDLIEVPAIPGTSCFGTYLRSTEKIPSLLKIGIKRAYPVDYFSSELFTWVSRERMQFVGHNKWLKNAIYVTKGVDDYLYLKSSNPQFLYLKSMKLDAVFQDAKEAEELSCSKKEDGNNCDILDSEFPVEEALVTPLIQLIVQELSGQRYMPTDQKNNANDDMSGMQSPNYRRTAAQPAQTVQTA